MDCTLSKYTDFLLSTPKYASATNMSATYDYSLSHDKISRWLKSSYLDSEDVWKAAKKLVRPLVNFSDQSGVDDSIVEKAHTDENAMICYHWDHSLQRYVKGVNFISLLYSHTKADTPIQVRIIEKTEPYTDNKTCKTKYKSPKTKNEHFIEML